ncbi:hypothetical protein E7T09_20000 [Deinococcus sp. KSM4-11]|uniref:hypothetical protein n=1 Tax=Deinococcus sp. KSM4-11 TaxID=2568654 RepID=UPI0010A59C5B|nr:hypothetical protein [Deinococcus sp. KSM4-11]THF84303.1 hypothetical protein E7T09_20000 [Deinococcus sp. KSM4-11]
MNRRLLVLSALSLGSAVAAPTPLTVTATASGYRAPATVAAGAVTVTFKNSGKIPVDLAFFRLKPGVTDAQFQAAATAVATQSAKDASWKLNQMVEVAGGVGDVPPGQSGAATITLVPGKYLLASLDADEKTHKTALSMGFLKTITVTGSAMGSAPAADYKINMVDYRFELPTNATAGRHTWQVMNSGKEPHFALVAKLMPGKTLKDAMAALMSQSQSGPPPMDFEHAVFAQVLTTGHAETVTWNLSKGSYVVVCFVATKDGTEHARMGMLQQLDVK